MREYLIFGCSTLIYSGKSTLKYVPSSCKLTEMNQIPKMTYDELRKKWKKKTNVSIISDSLAKL